MRNYLKKANRIVVKVGTSTLIYANGTVNLQAIDQLAFVLTELTHQEKEVILVSSGAIGAGLSKLGMDHRPHTIPAQQAVAAVGQAALMNVYNQLFTNYSQQTAQILLTRDVIYYPESRQNVRNTLEELLKMNVVPIVNENDTVSVDELDHSTKFGDNDQLSAIVAQLVEADLLIMLSDIDGFYSDNPATNKNAALYHQISAIDETLMNQAGGRGSSLGTGGMRSKLKAAARILASNQAMILANGNRPKVIFDILNGQEIGTLFMKEEL